MTLPHVIEAVLGLSLASLLAWRLYRLPSALDRLRSKGWAVGDAEQFLSTGASVGAPQTSTAAPAVKPTSHLVWASATLEHNEHGFITTPRVPCVDPNCFCRKPFPGVTP